MSQHDYNIANGGGAAVRADINAALLAILSQNSGATAPTTTKPFMFWYDSANTVLKMRNPADNGWLTVTDTSGALLAAVADAAVTTAKVADAAVTTAKVADAAVTTAKVADANITAAKLSGAQSGSAPIYGARAWVNFNGTGTVAIRASGNVSSITDNGVGDYTVNFTTAMPDANYSAVITAGFGSGSRAALRATNISDMFASSVRYNVSSSNGANDDVIYQNVSIFR
jgi:hypothetical protein